MKKQQVNLGDSDRVLFTEEMKKDYTILFPTMLPRHFKILSEVFNYFGYKTVLLENGTAGDSKRVIDAGLRSVHNDVCYPALLVIGQFIDALESGKYDVNKTALMMSQTGGGCRASNYIALIRKALKKAGYEQIPVISLNFSGLEKNPGFKITLKMVAPALYSILYGDLLMCLVNQIRPREIVKGSAEAMADKWTRILTSQIVGKHISYSKVKKNYQLIIDDFATIETDNEPHVKVGIVGEIFVKFSPLGNNNLEDFLVSEGAEPVMAGLLDFVMYCAYNPILDAKMYGKGKKAAPIYKLVCSYLGKKQQDLIDVIAKDGRFTPPSPFRKTCRANEGYISSGVKMGEGWLLTAEMLELIESGVNNIVCAQPFGCLPNHIVGKGMMKPIKERHEGVNIVAIDYDPGATKINQENRIKLMLANANATLEESREEAILERR